MSEISFNKQLEESFKNMTTFFEEMATLLQDCDRLMAENGYTTFNGNTAVYEMSKSLLNPSWWIPSYMGRVYVFEENLEDKTFTHVMFINLFLRYGEGGTHDVKFDDENTPLIVAGIIIPNNPSKFKFENWQTKSWFWGDNSEYDKHKSDEYNRWVNHDCENDGTVVEFYPGKNEKYWENIKQIHTFAYPLEDMKNTGVVKEIVIEKLIEMKENID